MQSRAWYLGCSGDQIAERVILVGDPGRVPRLSRQLDDVELLPINRGLATATGAYRGVRVTLAAFGMGAPIAAIVLHELFELGSRVFLRIGTAIALPPVQIGDLVIAEAALRYEGTSAAYAPADYPTVADGDLVKAAIAAADARAHRYHVGRFASYDAFYRDMFALEEATAERVRNNVENLSAQGVLAIDMETSAVLTVGKVLGCKAGSLCVASVNSLEHLRMSNEELVQREKDLIATALAALIATPLPPKDRGGSQQARSAATAP